MIKWNHASDDWHCPHAEIDLRVDGKFLFRMAARDASASFDWIGTYTIVETNKRIAYDMEDGRVCEVTFAPDDKGTQVVESFDMETENSKEQQRDGWQAILNNFKAYAEGK